MGVVTKKVGFWPEYGPGLVTKKVKILIYGKNLSDMNGLELGIMTARLPQFSLLKWLKESK